MRQNIPYIYSVCQNHELKCQHICIPTMFIETSKQSTANLKKNNIPQLRYIIFLYIQVLDQDGDGKISVGDFRYFMTTLGEKMSDDEVEEMLKSVYKRKHNNFDSIEYHGNYTDLYRQARYIWNTSLNKRFIFDNVRV